MQHPGQTHNSDGLTVDVAGITPPDHGTVVELADVGPSTHTNGAEHTTEPPHEAAGAHRQARAAGMLRAPRREEIYGRPRTRGVPAALKSERRRREEQLRVIIAASAVRVTRQNRVAVVGAQGGPGKTRLAYVLAAALAWIARLTTVVVDIDSDYSPLADLIADDQRSDKSLTDLLAHHAPRLSPANGENHTPLQPLPFSELRPYVSPTPSGMLVLAGPPDPDSMEALTLADFDRALTLLGGADVVLLDCAGGITRDRAAWAIARSDQRVVVARPERTGAAPVANALRDRVPTNDTTLVLNMVEGKSAELDAVRSLFAGAGLNDPIEIPHSPKLKQSLERATYQLERQRQNARLPITELAARIAERLQ